MSVTTVTTDPGLKLFGMFELDVANTVLYSRVESPGRGDSVPAHDFRGQDFFGAAPLVNCDDLRHRINYFRSSGAQADSFDFTCTYEDGDVPVRVLLARVRESSGGEGISSILIHIRRRL